MPSTTSSRDSEKAPPHHLSVPERIGYAFRDPPLLELALRHRSWCAENGGVESNERLEFLGDAVLGLVITAHLFAASPEEPEGVLARRRAELVNAVALADLARELHMGDAIMLGKGEEATGGRDKPSILADTLEAVFGAVYLDGGTEPARELILRLFSSRISDVGAPDFTSDHKSRLQELAARMFGELPRYELSEDGPEHQKVFTAAVALGSEVRGRGAGRTKKEAEQNAAQEAYDHLVASPAGDGTGDSVPTIGDEDA
jgi:ribonuclease-3